jgi:hypothetical protein
MTERLLNRSFSLLVIKAHLIHNLPCIGKPNLEKN